MSLNFVNNRASTNTGFFCNLSLKLPIETNVKLMLEVAGGFVVLWSLKRGKSRYFKSM